MPTSVPSWARPLSPSPTDPTMKTHPKFAAITEDGISDLETLQEALDTEGAKSIAITAALFVRLLEHHPEITSRFTGVSLPSDLAREIGPRIPCGTAIRRLRLPKRRAATIRETARHLDALVSGGQPTASTKADPQSGSIPPQSSKATGRERSARQRLRRRLAHALRRFAYALLDFSHRLLLPNTPAPCREGRSPAALQEVPSTIQPTNPMRPDR